MAVTVTETLLTNDCERISRSLAIRITNLALTGTYVAGGFAYDLDAKFRSQAGGNMLFCQLSDESATTNGGGLKVGYDRTNDKILLYNGAQRSNCELYAGTELGTTGLAITKLVIMAIGYNA